MMARVVLIIGGIAIVVFVATHQIILTDAFKLVTDTWTSLRSLVS